MAKLEVYAVLDSAVSAFNQPMFFRTRGEALRSFEVAVAKPENGFTHHPEHFFFYHIGYYDDQLGLLESVTPEIVCRAIDFLARPDHRVG